MQRSILTTEYTIIPVYYNNYQFLGNSGKFFLYLWPFLRLKLLSFDADRVGKMENNHLSYIFFHWVCWEW